MKRLIPLLLAVAMLLSFAACTQSTAPSKAPAQSSAPAASESTGNGDNTPEPVATAEPLTLSPDDPTTLSLTLFSQQAVPNNNNKLTNLLKEELGVTLQYEIISRSDTETKIGTMLVGGTYNDLIGTTDLDCRFHEGGALIPLDEYLDNGSIPLLYEHVAPYRDRLSWEGEFYIFPDYNRFYGDLNKNEHDMSAFYLQKAVLEENGFPDTSPISLDTYFGWIEDYMTKYPKIDGIDTIGFLICAAPDKEFCLQNPPAHLSGHPNDGGVVVDDGIASMYTNQDISKDYYKFLNDMDKKGLVYKESFTLTYDDYLAKLAQGNVLGMFDQFWNFGTARDALRSDKRDERTWAACEVVYDGVTPWYGEVPVMGANQGFGVSVTAQKNGKVEKALAFLNHLMEEKWQKRLSWGIEGEDYLVDENGMYYRTDEQVDNSKDTTWKLNNKLDALHGLMPKHEGYYSDGNSYDPGTSITEFQNSLSDYDKNFLEQYNAKNWRAFVTTPLEMPVYYPAWKISLPTGSDAKIAETELKQVYLEYLPQLVTCPADQFEAKWSEYVAKIEQINYPAFVNFLQEGINEKIAAAGG